MNWTARWRIEPLFFSQPGTILASSLIPSLIVSRRRRSTVVTSVTVIWGARRRAQLTLLVVVPPHLVPLFCANLGLVGGALWWRVAGCCLAWTARLCRGLESLEAEILHARLLLVVVAHAEGTVGRVLRLELELRRLRHRHLVVGKGSGSSVANTRRVGAIVVVHIELLLHVVVGSVVRGQKRSRGLIR